MLLGDKYPLVSELIPPVNAQDVPRPRSAGLEPPRQLVNVCMALVANDARARAIRDIVK